MSLLEIERALGRVRERAVGAASVDLDLLVYGDEVVDEPGLRVPHPRLHERRFALEPLAELDPELEIPGLGKRVGRTRGARLTAMSHLDDLDEFEAELELSLKREYSAVFSLFRYCVLTQDATYLCNKLDLEALPQVELSVLPRPHGGRVGVGQEPAEPHHPARRGLHVGRRHGRGAPRRGRGAAAHRRGARGAHRPAAPGDDDAL